MTQEEKNKGSKDRTDLGTGPANMVKVEIFEDKPKYPPYVLVEDALGHDIYHAPADHQPTEQNERPWSPKQQTPTVPKSKPKTIRLKAPADTKSVGPDTSGPSTESDHQPTTKTGKLWSPQPKNSNTAKSKSKQAKTKTPVTNKPVAPTKSGLTTWSDDAVTMAYHRHKLDTLLASDPVATALEIRPLGQLGGTVSPLPPFRTVTALVTLLRESNMVAGRFDPNSLFDLGFDSITSTLTNLHKRLAILVGTTPR